MLVVVESNIIIINEQLSVHSCQYVLKYLLRTSNSNNNTLLFFQNNTAAGATRGSARHSGICLALDRPRGTAHVGRLRNQGGFYSLRA